MSENRGYLEKTRQKQKRGKKGVKRMNFEISRKTRCMYVGVTQYAFIPTSSEDRFYRSGMLLVEKCL